MGIIERFRTLTHRTKTETPEEAEARKARMEEFYAARARMTQLSSLDFSVVEPGRHYDEFEYAGDRVKRTAIRGVVTSVGKTAETSVGGPSTIRIPEVGLSSDIDRSRTVPFTPIEIAVDDEKFSLWFPEALSEQEKQALLNQEVAYIKVRSSYYEGAGLGDLVGQTAALQIQSGPQSGWKKEGHYAI